MSLYYSILNRCGKHRTREIGKARSLLVAPKPSPCHSEPASAVRNLLLRVSPRLSEASKMNSDVPLQLLRHWGLLHAVRTVLSLCAFLLFLFALGSVS